ncbi:MAG: hypothetical protein ABIR18_01560 [Chitinophagaceae bacterium]
MQNTLFLPFSGSQQLLHGTAIKYARHSIFKKLALIATAAVLILINTTPTAGLSKTPNLYNTPAANGSATTL